jgi:hypothetical protein
MMDDFYDVLGRAVIAYRTLLEDETALCKLYPEAIHLHALVDQDAELMREFDDFVSEVLDDSIERSAIMPRYNSICERTKTMHKTILLTMAALFKPSNDGRE